MTFMNRIARLYGMFQNFTIPNPDKFIFKLGLSRQRQNPQLPIIYSLEIIANCTQNNLCQCQKYINFCGEISWFTNHIKWSKYLPWARFFMMTFLVIFNMGLKIWLEMTSFDERFCKCHFTQHGKNISVFDFSVTSWIKNDLLIISVWGKKLKLNERNSTQCLQIFHYMWSSTWFSIKQKSGMYVYCFKFWNRWDKRFFHDRTQCSRYGKRPIEEQCSV